MGETSAKMKGALLVLALVAACVGATDPYEEAFTIFIDLDDFHVTQVGNHEFMTGDKIREHDNVILHLSEDEMRHHIEKHETHDCEHPAEVHEVVSFIQEKMYEAPAAPSFIDDMINTNYVQNGAWDTAKMYTPQQQMPQYNFGANMWAPSAPVAAAVPTHAQVAAVPAPKQTVSAPVSASAPTQQAAANPAAEEEEAIRRFRDAYQAFKYLNKAVGGLVDTSAPASAATASVTAETDSSASHGNWWASLFDDNDRKMMDMFTHHATHFNAPAFSAPQQQLPQHSAFGSEYDKALNTIVDETLKNVMGDQFSDPQQQPLAGLTAQEPSHHHHHHHHHHEEDFAPAPPVQLPQYGSEQQPATAVETLDPHPTLSATDKQALVDLVAALSNKETDVKQLLKEAFVANGKPATQADAVVQSMRDVAQEVAVAKEVANAPVVASAPAQEQPLIEVGAPVVGNTRPAAPVMTSHIEKAPGATDFIPESVYNMQQSVPFADKPQAVKHVPKRILIPRMEEPGPVIGGGSRPQHIQIPFPDSDISSNTRPAAPAHLSSWSSITTVAEANAIPNTKAMPAVATSAAISIGVEKSSAAPSVKASTVAAANDEALSAPEVVIF
eukprot:c9472_g1_i1.p1 GENE.c9472_g1_i1~~c9472_g1_i1.p1  ORF type:complete len:613 (-),score=190.31 c9472_g1_i1:110-1948(-)